VDSELAGLQRTYETSEGVERQRHLLAALVLCSTRYPLPQWAYEALRDQLIPLAKLQPGPHWRRYRMVIRAYEKAQLKGQPISKRKAAKEVSKALDQPFATIWNSYKAIMAIIKNTGPK
jgi:hypothetical protein